MKLLLVVPAMEDEKERRLKGKAFRMPQISLGILASLTPEDVEVCYVDENLEDINYECGADLVGITVMTATAPRAYKIAQNFKQVGTKVIFGGIHPSILPQEALRYGDCVVVGEAEYVWREVIEDFKRNELKPIYYGKRVDSRDIISPKREVFKNKGYYFTSILQATRGCPYDCDFCSVSLFFGRSFRNREIKDIIKEIEEIKHPLIGFLDDNLMGNKRFAKKLFYELIPLKIRWLGQASLTIADDLELLRLAKKSGCSGLFIGIESISESGLKEVNKRYQKAKDLLEKIKRIQEEGILIEGSFIFGLDSDTPDVFDETLDFVFKSKMALASFGILTPYPGTKLQKRLMEENRIITYDWRLYDCGHAVFKPKNMTIERLQEGLDYCWYKFYSYKNIFKRVFSLGYRFPLLGLPVLILNLSYKRMLFKTTDISSWFSSKNYGFLPETA
ncbi:MAG: radical SAM protein [candidate division WOR-3 bacterium]